MFDIKLIAGAIITAAVLPASAPAATLFQFETVGTGLSDSTSPYAAGAPDYHVITNLTYSLQVDLTPYVNSQGLVTSFATPGGGAGASAAGYTFNLRDTSLLYPSFTPISLCFSNPSAAFTLSGVVTPTCGSSISYDGYSNNGYYGYILSYTGTVTRLTISQVASNETFSRVTGVIPEPSTWALMLAGFGMVGFAMRRRRASVAIA